MADRLRQFRVQNLLGKGAFGDVYKVRAAGAGCVGATALAARGGWQSSGAWWFLPCLPMGYSVSPLPRTNQRQVVRISDGQVYAMKKVSIASMSQKEIADTLNEIR